MSSNLAIPGGERWRKEFPFLATAAMEKVFLLLLALARSRTGLRRLHDLLPDNCRLLRTDQLRLEKFWGDMYDCSPGGQQLDEDRAGAMFYVLCPASGLTEYYVRHLLEKRSVFAKWGWLTHEWINGWLNPFCPSRAGFSGSGDFTARLFDVECRLSCGFLSNDATTALAVIGVKSAALTESFTFKALSLPNYSVLGPPESGIISFVFLVPATTLVPHVAEWDKRFSKTIPYERSLLNEVLALESFPQALELLLQRQHIPVTGVQLEPVPDYASAALKKKGITVITHLH